MHSSSTGPSDSERSSGLPCMRWPLQGLRRLWVVLLSVPPAVGEQPGWCPEQRRRVRQQRKAKMVASRFGRGVHTCRGAGTQAGCESVEKQALLPDLRDVFLCHAWDDRRRPAKELHDLLESLGVSVWFSEKDVVLGSPLLREIDKGLAKSRVGIVLVTPRGCAAYKERESPTKSYRHS
jgi:hypothetical protein